MVYCEKICPICGNPCTHKKGHDIFNSSVEHECMDYHKWRIKEKEEDNRSSGPMYNDWNINSG